MRWLLRWGRILVLEGFGFLVTPAPWFAAGSCRFGGPSGCRCGWFTPTPGCIWKWLVGWVFVSWLVDPRRVRSVQPAHLGVKARPPDVVLAEAGLVTPDRGGHHTAGEVGDDLELSAEHVEPVHLRAEELSAPETGVGAPVSTSAWYIGSIASAISTVAAKASALARRLNLSVQPQAPQPLVPNPSRLPIIEGSFSRSRASSTQENRTAFQAGGRDQAE